MPVALPLGSLSQTKSGRQAAHAAGPARQYPLFYRHFAWEKARCESARRASHQSLFGNSLNAVRTQIWIAVSTYLLVAILKQELEVDRSLSEIRQILSVNPFEKTLLLPLLTDTKLQLPNTPRPNQLPLFDF